MGCCITYIQKIEVAITSLVGRSSFSQTCSDRSSHKEQVTKGYQKGATLGFYAHHHEGQTIDGYYVDTCSSCPCTAGGGPVPLTFVGTNYYYESGVDTVDVNAYYFSDPQVLIAITLPNHGSIMSWTEQQQVI